MHCVNLLLLTCMSIVGFVSAANPACEKYEEWVEKSCSGDGVCGPANSMCHKGKCLCAVGFYYSVGSRTCVDSCTDLQDSYIAYPEGGIDENNVYTKNGVTAAQCKQTCSQDPKCLSTERSTDKQCHFHYVPPSASNWEIEAAWTFYQRNCA